jgi:lysyl-tRNA synthetase class 2
VDNSHNPEFMMLEAYEAYGSYETMADLTRELVVDAARAVGKTVVQARDGGTIDLEAPWRHATLHELVSEAVGATVTVETPAEELSALADAHDVALQQRWDAGAIALELFEKLGEAAPDDPRPRGGLGPHHQRGRTGAGLLGVE